MTVCQCERPRKSRRFVDLPGTLVGVSLRAWLKGLFRQRLPRLMLVELLGVNMLSLFPLSAHVSPKLVLATMQWSIRFIRSIRWKLEIQFLALLAASS